MTSVVEVVEMMKQGLISKEEMISRIAQLEVASEVSINYSEKQFQDDPGLIQLNDLEDYQGSQESQESLNDEIKQFTYEEFNQDNELEMQQVQDYLMQNQMPQEYQGNKSYDKSHNSSQMPKYYDYNFSSSQQTDFHNRQNTFIARKEAYKKKIQEEKAQNEMRECTFQPKIKKKQFNQSQSQNSSQIEVFERLYQLGENEKLKEMQEQAKFLKEQDEMRECTFQPKTTETGVTARYNENLNLERRAPQSYLKCHKYREQEGCTFKPQINGVSKQMPNAQEYLSENIFERLAKPRQQLQTVESQDLPPQKPSSRTQYNRSRDFSNYNEEDGELLLSQLNFWERQAIYEKIKQERANWRQQQAQNEIQDIPETLTSKQGWQFQNTFEDRNDQLLRKREENKSKYEENHSFQPTITDKARNKRKKTVEELSKGDHEQMINSKLEIKTLQEKREMQHCTFKPQTNKKESSSKLGLHLEVDQYIQREKELQAQRNQIVDAVNEQRTIKEMEECSFNPVIKDAPGYVKRIARNMAILKAMK